MLCAVIKEESYALLDEANHKADLIELRLDLFTPKNFSFFRAACKLPVIFKLSSLQKEFLRFAPDYVDLPHGSSFEQVPRTIKRICSFHDERKTPDLPALYKKMQQTPAEYYKIATFANSTLDALRMLQFARQTGCIGLCMGELGQVSRILAPVFKVPWTYAPLNAAGRTASGQLLLSELEGIFRYSSLSPQTALYGLIGDPISQSRGDRIHNFGFEQLGIDAVYVKMVVKPEELHTFLPFCREVGFRGLSVTIPLKELIQKGETFNTVRFDKERMLCWNTDGVGALDALEQHLKVARKRVVILGAGGAAKAIAREAKLRGANVIIANRTPERARGLNLKSVPLDDFAKQGYDILINCTPINPVSQEALLEGKVVMDIVTKPEMTPFLAAAAQKGCTLVYGMEMWVQQAIGQYNQWFLDEKVDC